MQAEALLRAALRSRRNFRATSPANETLTNTTTTMIAPAIAAWGHPEEEDFLAWNSADVVKELVKAVVGVFAGSVVAFAVLRAHSDITVSKVPLVPLVVC